MDGDRYQRLLNEHLKVRTQISILKRNIVDNETKIEELESKLKERDHDLHKGAQEIDSLRFNNKRLTKRLQTLQNELRETASKSQSWILGSGSAEIKRELERCKQALEVTAEDLHRKIADNERLSEQLDNIQSLHDVALAELRKHSTSTEGDLKALKEELKKCKSSSEEQLAVLRKQKTALERQAQSADEGIASMQQELNESKRKLFEQVEINAAVLGHIRNAIDQSGESPPLDFASFLASVQRKHRETCGALWKRFVETVSVLYKQWLAILLPPSSEELRKHLNGAIQEILSATINNDSQAADSATINRLLHSLSRAIALEIQRLAAEDSISTDIQVQNTLLESTLQTILNQLRAEHIPFDHLANSLQNLENQLSAKSEALKSHSSELYKATETLALAVNQTRSLLWQLNDLLKDQKRDSLLTSDQFHIDSVKGIIESLGKLSDASAVNSLRTENERLKLQLHAGSEQNRLQLEGLNAHMAELEKRLAAVQQEGQVARKELNAKEAQIIELLAEKERLAERFNRVDSERRQSLDATGKLQADLADRQSALDRSTAEIRRLFAQTEKLEQERGELQQFINRQERELVAERSKLSQLQSDQQVATDRLAVLTERLKTLEAQTATSTLNEPKSVNSTAVQVGLISSFSEAGQQTMPTALIEQRSQQTETQTIPPAKSDSDIRPANQQIGKLREFYLHQLSSYSDTIHFLQSQLHAWRIAERHGNQSPTIVTTTGTVPDDRLQEAYRRINELERILDDAEIRHKRQVGELFDSFVTVQSELEKLKKENPVG